MSLVLRIGELTDGGDTSSSDDIRRALARALHDRVAETVTTLQLNLENFKTDQVGNPSVLREITSILGGRVEVESVWGPRHSSARDPSKKATSLRIATHG